MSQLTQFQILTCTGILLCLPSGLLSDQVVSNFQDFSEELQTKFFQPDEVLQTKPGVQLFNSFGIGYMLANIHEKLWSIPVDGISSTLRALDKYVAADYAHLLGLFKKNRFKVTSNVYSRHDNITRMSPSLSSLMSHVMTVDHISSPQKFVDSFSSLIDIGTKGQLENEMLPKALWTSVFDNITQGGYVNTLHYKERFPMAWMKLGDLPFNLDSNVSFMETEGEFPIYRNENATFVILRINEVPVQDMIFAMPEVEMPFNQLKQELRTALRMEDSLFIRRKMKIQLPELKVTNMARHHLGLIEMGVNETFCNVNETTGGESRSIVEFIQQPMIQVNKFILSPDHIELSSGTGSIVSLNVGDMDSDIVDEAFDDDDITSILVNDDEDDEEESSLSRTSLKTVKGHSSSSPYPAIPLPLLRKLYSMNPPNNPTHRSNLPSASNHLFQLGKAKRGKPMREKECKTTYQVYEQIRGSQNTRESEDVLTFNKPFLFVLRDEILGETFSAYVSSLCSYNEILKSIETEPLHAWLHDVFKVAFWKCF